MRSKLPLATVLLATVLLAGCETTQSTRWEYQAVHGGFTTGLREVMQARSGTDWELVAVPVQQHGDAVFIFKRPVRDGS